MEKPLDDGLKERLLKPAGEVRPDWLVQVKRSFEDRDYKLKGGEPLNQTCERAMRGLTKISEAGYERPAVAAHGNLIAAVLGAADPRIGYDAWESMKNPHIYKLHFEGVVLAGFEDLG